MLFRALHDSDFDAVHEAFVDAFSDYVVKLQLSPEQLREMLLRRGWSPELSVAAVDGDRLVAFTLNGFGTWRGNSTAYDTGTGVVPSHRRLGLSRAMFEAVLPRLRNAGIEQYLLEVIETNEKALPLYRSLGFTTTRMLQCWSFPSDGTAHADVREIAPDWALFASWCDVTPSWQNSTDSILRGRDPHAILGALVDGVLAGFAVVYPSNGDVPQLAVAHSQRRRGVGTALLQRAASAAGKPLRILNIDEASGVTRAFLTAAGASPTVRQHEMLLPLA